MVRRNTSAKVRTEFAACLRIGDSQTAGARSSTLVYLAPPISALLAVTLALLREDVQPVDTTSEKCGDLAWRELVEAGFAVVDTPVGSATTEALDVLTEWFQLPSGTKQAAATAAAGRGFFALPDKEVLEVMQGWGPAGMTSAARLAAKAAFNELDSVASNLLQLLFTSSADSALRAKPQQVQGWLGQPAAGRSGRSSSSSSSSVLHVSSYGQGTARAAQSLGGSEAHVDRGLLTVIADTAPGLQVLSRDGSWTPVSPTPKQLVVLVGHTLSWATAGRLPAAVHKIVLPASASSSGRSSSSSSSSRVLQRLSLEFKLQVAPDAEFAPAAILGTSRKKVDVRYRVPKRTHQLMQAFDATHNGSSNQQQQQQQPPKSKRGRTGSAAAARPQEPRVVTITVRTTCGREVAFRIKDNRRMERVFEAFVCALDIEGHVKYVFYGRRISAHDTPRSLRMRDGDIVDAFIE